MKPQPLCADREIFAENLLTLITKAGITVDIFSDTMKFSRDRVRRWTSAVAFPQYEVMVKICTFFDYYDIHTLITKRLEPTALQKIKKVAVIRNPELQ